MGKVRAHHRTVDRVAELLEASVARPGATLSQLARAVGAPVSSVQKLVDGLVAAGYLDETDRRYRLGPAPSVLSARAGRRTVETVRHADLVALGARVGLPVQLAVRVGDDAVWVDWAGADEAFDYALSSRVRRPLGESAAGRVLLAHLPEVRRREVLARSDLDAAEAVTLLDATARIRRDGCETGESGRLLPGAEAVAVPVVDNGRDGPEVVAALSVAARGGGLSGRAAEVAAALREVADRHR